MWTSLLHWLRHDPDLAQWFSAFATLAAVIVALSLGLLPIWLNRRDRKRRVRKLERWLASKANGCFVALEAFEERYKGSPPPNNFMGAQKPYFLTRNLIEELVVYSGREDVLIVLTDEDVDSLAELMIKHRLHASTYSLVEGRPSADQWKAIQRYMYEMLKSVVKLVGRRHPMLARDEQLPPSNEVPASPEEQPQPSGKHQGYHQGLILMIFHANPYPA